MMRFQVLFGVLQAVCASIRSVKLQRLKSQNQRDILYISYDSTTPSARLKRLIQTHPTCLRHGVGRYTAQTYTQ